MQDYNKNTVGLTVGVFFGLAHLGWVILVAVKLAKPFLDWILHLHFMEISFTMQSFNWSTGLSLVVVTFVVGYVLGWVMTAIWNKLIK